MQALSAALDSARRSRSLTWPEMMQEINRPFEGTPSIPISLATVRGIPDKSSVTSAVILQVLRWLHRTPESFLSGSIPPAKAGATLPEPGSGRILRLDTRALHAALDEERLKRKMTWKQVADELPGFRSGMLLNLAHGPLIGFPRVVLLTQWLDRPMADFVRSCTK